MYFACKLAALAVAVLVSDCVAQCGPGFLPGDQIPGVSAGTGVGSVRAALEWDFDGAGPQASKLIVAGSFTDAGGSPASNLALWDGQLWTAFGAGANGTVSRLVAHNGEVIAAGAFTTIGGVAAPDGLAAFDGASWRALPSPGGVPKQLLSRDGVLYACGPFTFGGTPGNYVASFNGTAWSAVGAPFDGPINDVAFHDTTLLAGGGFTTSGTDVAFCLAKWDGVTGHWSTYKGGTSDVVNCIRQFGSDLYVGGVFTGIGSPVVAVSRLAKWNGLAWSAVSANTVFSEVQTLGGTDTAFVAGGIRVGGSHALKVFALAGSGAASMPPSFAELTGNFDNDLFWIGSYQGRLHVGGTYQAPVASSGDIKHFSMSRVIDGRWHALTGGLNGRFKAIAVHQGEVFASGDFIRWKDTPVSKIVKWNGTDWVQFSTHFPNATETYPAVLKSWNNRLYVIGDSVNDLQAFWDGIDWRLWENGVNSPQNFVEFVGNRLMTGTQVGWRQITPPFPDTFAGALVGRARTTIPFGTGYMVGGDLQSAGGISVQRVAAYNGTAWSAVGQGLTGGIVFKLLNFGGVPYAFGQFTSSGATTLPGGARWDGATWQSAFSSSSPNGVRDAVATNDRIFAVGLFTGETPAAALMQFDGVSWQSRGGLIGDGPFGIDGGSTVTLVGDEVWITGQFARAAGIPSYQLARYRLALPGPQVNSSPASIAVHRSEPASFTVGATGSGELTYQWRRGGEPLGAPSLPTLTIASASDGDRGMYDCVVSGACGGGGSGQAVSRAARLTILTADLGVQGGGAGADSTWDNNDFIAFIDYFFDLDPAADVGQQGGVPGGDGAWDNNDFIVFIGLFFDAF